MINGAVPAVGSRYFSSCFSSHMPSEEVDVVFVEVSSAYPLTSPLLICDLNESHAH
jgi:hypothetical protein